MRYFPSRLATSINSELGMIDHQSYLLQTDLCPEIIHYILGPLKKVFTQDSLMKRLKLSIIFDVPCGSNSMKVGLFLQECNYQQLFIQLMLHYFSFKNT